MEIINMIVISFTVIIIYFVEKVIYRQPPEEKEIVEYQKMLDEMTEKLKLTKAMNAQEEILRNRNTTRHFILIFSGLFLTFILLFGIAFNIPLTNIMTICLCAIVLIAFGLMKIAVSKKQALALLITVVLSSLVFKWAFDRILLTSPYSYFYLAILIIMLFFFMIARSKNQEKA